MASLESLSLSLVLRSELGNERPLGFNLWTSGLKRLKSLETSFLRTGNYFEIPNAVFDEFLQVLESKSALKNLSLRFPSSGNSILDGKSLEKFGDVWICLKRIENLDLNFSCHSFDEATLECFFDKLKSFEKLQTLSLDFSHSWRKPQGKLLERLIKNLKELEYLRKTTLNFQYCRSLTIMEEAEVKSLKFELCILYGNTRCYSSNEITDFRDFE